MKHDAKNLLHVN